jgi:hypothetical protein
LLLLPLELKQLLLKGLLLLLLEQAVELQLRRHLHVLLHVRLELPHVQFPEFALVARTHRVPLLHLLVQLQR